MTDTYTLWVCRDCMLHHANGECGSCHNDGGHDREPWSTVDENNTFTMGLMREQHEEGCTSYDDGDECFCGTRSFSWWPCNACGSMLGGGRHGFTGWVVDHNS